MKEKILVIVGPTGVGKTSLSIKLAQEFDGEIISGDSMQIYKGLDIGTAKVTAEEAQEIPHYLIDEKEWTEAYSVSDFQKRARELIEAIHVRGKLPIVVGGTGLYIESLLFNVSHGGQSDSDPGYRKQLEALAADKGPAYLWQVLTEKDPEAAENIHPNNERRVIRALEVIEKTGEKFSDQQDEHRPENMAYDAYVIGLDTDRKLLYERINQRVDQMVEEGLLEEAKMLYPYRHEDLQATKAIGYKELFPYLDGRQDLEDGLDALKQASRRYAKRQLTWFRNRTPISRWYDLLEGPGGESQVIEDVKDFLKD